MAVSLSGGLICFIAIGNTLYQVFAKDTDIALNRVHRISVAGLFAVIGTMWLAETGADYLPMFAFIVVCIAETCRSHVTIYKLYALSLGAWICFALLHGDYIYASVNSILFVLNMLVLNNGFQARVRAFVRI